MFVSLLNPPWRADGGRIGIRAGSRWSYTVDSLGRDATVPFPFFLAHAASLLRANGFDAALMDGVADQAQLDPYLAEVERVGPQLIIYETSTPSFRYDCRVADRLKAVLPEAKLAFAGPHVTVFPEQTLFEQAAADFVLLGEYEATALELAQALDLSKPLGSVRGLAWRSRGEVRVNERRPLIDDLDALPLPAREEPTIHRYHESLCARRPNVQLMSSRGCVFRCPFCLWPKVMYGGQNLRARTPAKVVDEIEQLERGFDFCEYYFDDDAINLKAGHVEAICDELTRRGLCVAWSCMAHTGRASFEQLERMRRAGCEAIKWGVETGDEEVMRRLRKGTTLAKVRDVLGACRQLGIRTHATFTIGLPGETADSIRRTRDFMLELAPDSTQISIATPFPGTDIFEQCGRAVGEWEKFDGATHAVSTSSELTAEELESTLAELQTCWEDVRRRGEGWPRRIWRAIRARLSG